MLRFCLGAALCLLSLNVVSAADFGSTLSPAISRVADASNSAASGAMNAYAPVKMEGLLAQSSSSSSSSNGMSSGSYRGITKLVIFGVLAVGGLLYRAMGWSSSND